VYGKIVNNIFIIEKGAYLNYLVQGGQLYEAFPFSKTSLPRRTLLARFLDAQMIVRQEVTAPKKSEWLSTVCPSQWYSTSLFPEWRSFKEKKGSI
jgi:hypothetical protein